ncbi:MAG: helix-turn-helix domain-containing protein [Gammaproteobacteria bacterium]
MTLAQLNTAVAQLLAGDDDYGGVASGRVRDVPDPRTIRYYTTLGLLDRPAEMRGRTAYYGRRHVLQLVAIKRLQAQGLALAAIQQRLAGSDDRLLAELAALAPAALERLEVDNALARTRASAAPERFWEVTPALAAPLPAPSPVANPVLALRLDEAIVLVVDGLATSAVDAEIGRQLAAAAAPLLDCLRALRQRER